jgi:hypothetical protein
VIPAVHPAIEVDGCIYDLSHLSAFSTYLVNKGRVAGTDLTVEIRFSNHAVTRRAKHGESPHVLDHFGTGRVFDSERFDLSLQLRAILEQIVLADALSYETQSYGGTKNLISLRASDGRQWAIVFCFVPAADGVRMDILSVHEKIVQQRQISRKNLSYFARRCLFENRRVP